MLAGYSCTTCFGASGPIDAGLEKSINDNDVVACAVLSGNRNFEARIHPSVRAAFLASPPLVVAFALAGRVDIDLANEPLGNDPSGKPVFLKDLWPTQDELAAALNAAVKPAYYRKIYGMDFEAAHPQWKAIPKSSGETVRVERRVHLYQGAAVSRRALYRVGPARISRCARARDPRQFDHDRPHQPDQQHQGELDRRHCICKASGSSRWTSTITAPGA